MSALARVLALIAGSSALLVAGAAEAADPPLQTQLDVAARLLDQPVGRPWAIALTVGATVTAPEGAPTPPMTHAVLRFPHARLNADRFPSCSVATVQAKGPTACPRGSRVGSGSGVVDVRPLIPGPVHVVLTMFNAERAGAVRHLAILAQAQEVGVTLVLDAALRRTSGRYGYRLDFVIPPLHTLDNAPLAALQSFTITVRARRQGVSYVEAPRNCPAGGLPFAGAFDFSGAPSTSVAAAISCTLTAVSSA